MESWFDSAKCPIGGVGGIGIRDSSHFPRIGSCPYFFYFLNAGEGGPGRGAWFSADPIGGFALAMSGTVPPIAPFSAAIHRETMWQASP